MLANAGLPAVLAQDEKFRTHFFQQGGPVPHSPDVELLCGDVIGFQLDSDQWTGPFGSVTFQMHRALYNGEPTYYVRTDASDQDFATSNRLVFVPLLNAALAAEGATSQLYTFENGTDEQFPVMSHIPNQEGYSPAWHVHRVTFNGTPTFLGSAEAIREAEAAGDVTVEAQNLVVNFPVVKWPGGELAEDTDKTTYLGTGPLITPVNTETMRVTFKMHQCYPRSRYILTDTSGQPMADNMSIVQSPPTAQLADVGATDEIWVFANGIEGPGVMGYQPGLFDHAAGNAIWSPFWNHFTVQWKDEAEAVIVTSSDQLREIIDSGAVDVFNGVPASHPNGFVVNCPVPILSANDFHLNGGM